MIQRLGNRLIKETPPDKVKHLLTTAFLLTGLRVHREVAKKLFQGVKAMSDSDTYLAIIDEGKEEALKKIILRLGQKRFGAPNELVKSKVSNLSDIDQLEKIAERILDVSSWQELLESP